MTEIGSAGAVSEGLYLVRGRRRWKATPDWHARLLVNVDAHSINNADSQ